MIYNSIKKMSLVLILCLTFVAPSFAQNNMEAMRFLTVNALVQYGQKLYDRGDFNEACAVFNHVLTYDRHQAQALEYLKDMGRAPSTPFHVQNVIVLRNSSEQALSQVDVSDTGSLKKAIEAKKRSIERLRAQIMQIKANLAAQPAI